MTDRRLTQKGMGVCQVATSPNGVSAGVPPVTVAMGEGTIRSIYPSSSSSSLTPFFFSSPASLSSTSISTLYTFFRAFYTAAAVFPPPSTASLHPWSGLPDDKIGLPGCDLKVSFRLVLPLIVHHSQSIVT